jgi:hypothetical protein
VGVFNAAVLWADPDPDPAFYLNADPGRPKRISADPDPDPDQTLSHKKLNFYMKNIPYFKQVRHQKT